VTVVSDVACVSGGMTFWMPIVREFCVRQRWLGPLLTFLFACLVIDTVSLMSIVLGITPLLPCRSKALLDQLEDFIKPLDILTLGSVALQASLFMSVWRVYRALREAGLYPPDMTPQVRNASREVSLLEIVCESEDVALLDECSCRKQSQAPNWEHTIPAGRPLSPRIWARDED